MQFRLKCELVTEYHHELATEGWLRKLSAHIRSSIASHPEFHTTNGDGAISSTYNEERFMGPLSLIKNDFVVSVRVSRRFSIRKDHYSATVRYKPDAGIFETLHEKISTVETRARNRKNHARVGNVVKTIERGCPRDVIGDWRCPWCGSEIAIYFHPRGDVFAVSCPNGHFHRHSHTTTPPAWWREAVTDDWLDCCHKPPTET